MTLQTEADALLKLWKPDESFTSFAFGQAMGIKESTAKRLLQNAEERGLVRKIGAGWQRSIRTLNLRTA